MDTPFADDGVSPTSSKPVWLAAAFGLWFIALCALYAVHALGCAYAWPAATIRTALVAMLALVLLIFAATLVRARKSLGDDFVGQATGWTFAAALVATLLTFIAPIFLTTCV